MKKLTCKKCGKVVEGYNDNHTEHLMQQHMLKHEREKKLNKKTNIKKKSIQQKKEGKN